MEEAIKSFSILEGDKAIVLGDMYELGVDEIKYHQEITDYCQSSNIEKIILIGKIFSDHVRNFLVGFFLSEFFDKFS